MAFKLGDLVIDRIVEGIAEKSDGTLLYRLTNLQEATIDITADSVDAVDGTGTVIKTFYRGKTGEFTATNSLISLPIIGAMSGEDSIQASASFQIRSVIQQTLSASVSDRTSEGRPFSSILRICSLSSN